MAAEAVALYRDVSYAGGVAVSLLNLGLAQIHQASWAQASGTLDESLELYAELGHKDGISYCLEGLAAVVAFCGDDVEAAELLGAAAALRGEIGATLEPHERDLHERTVAAVGVQLSDDDFDAAWRRGAQLPLDDAVELGSASAREAASSAASRQAEARPAP